MIIGSPSDVVMPRFRRENSSVGVLALRRHPGEQSETQRKRFGFRLEPDVARNASGPKRTTSAASMSTDDVPNATTSARRARLAPHLPKFTQAKAGIFAIRHSCW
jgi:hypothetical protein